MLFLGIILFILSILLFIKVCYDKKHLVELNTETIEKNKQIEQNNIILNKEKDHLEECKTKLEIDLENIREAMYKAGISADEFTRQLAASAQSFMNLLDKEYQEHEDEYDNHMQLLQESYDKQQDIILNKISQEQSNLDKIRSTRIAAIEAQRREKEIKEKLSFYCLQPTDNEKDDIRALERVKPNLHQPRILCMLIWSTYFQKPMTALCNNILGTAIVSGIYKITNQETGECYIGQAVDVAKRWKDHAKCGLGIDTPANNKLYKAIQEYGIWNFSWELLEKCDKELLNEKEKYYIELYDSKNYGYNSSIGIKKA